MSVTEGMTDDPNKRPYKPVVSDFKLYHILGEGAYAKVYFGLFKKNGQFYAIKVVDKDHVQRYNKFDAVINERNVLNRLKGHPGIISLYYTLQDSYSLYYVLEHCQGGELYDQIRAVCYSI